MNSPRLKRLTSCYFFLLVFSLPFSSLASARQQTGPEEGGQEGSASQAQATMASLFGRGAKMPGIPNIRGTIALPAFDSSKMTVDEKSLSAAERQGRETGN